MTLPLTKLCHKATVWHFGDTEKEAFQHLKDEFTMAPVLSYWAPDLPMTVETDASDQAIAAILLVTPPDTEIHPVAFSSQSLQGTKCNYDTHNKELLAIYQAYINWQHYLEGSINIIDMVTNHKNLEYFMTTKKLTQRQVHWSEYLSQFNAKIWFRLGRLGTKPDALTHHWDLYQEEGRNANSSANIQPIFLSEQLVDADIMGHVSSLTPSENTFSNILDHANILDTISSIILNDDLARSVIEKLNSTDPPNGWMRQAESLFFEDCLYIPDYQDLRPQSIFN